MAFPPGSSPAAQSAALRRFNLAGPLYKWEAWRDVLPKLNWGEKVEKFSDPPNKRRSHVGGALGP
mgnify:CR=1 FL=1